MASAQVVETSVVNNSPSQDSNHPDDLFQSRYVTPGFKPFSYSLLRCGILVSLTLALLKKIRSVKQKSRTIQNNGCYSQEKLLQKSKEEYTSPTSKKTVDSCVEQFKKKIMEGPYYIIMLYM